MKGLIYKFKAGRIKTDKTYNSKLINELINEHSKLFSLYRQIIDEYKNKNYKKTLKLLKKFYELYNLHILKEDKKLYTYLIIKYKFFDDIKNRIIEKQIQMKEITKTLESFVLEYNNLQKIKNPLFLEELKKLGSALNERVEFEEKELYEKY